MKNLKLLVFVLLAVQITALDVEAKVFSGFKRSPTSVVNELEGPVRILIETDKQFKILIGKHAAFYNFPKDQNEADLRQALERSHTTNIPFKFKVDRLSHQIISIDDGQ